MNRFVRIVTDHTGWFVIVFIILTIVSPYVLTRGIHCENILLPSLCLNFENTGQIGDTIGGLTAPVIGLLNVILLYVTLQRQNEQMAQQGQQFVGQIKLAEIHFQEHRRYSEMDRRMDKIEAVISNLKITIVSKSDSLGDSATSYVGVDAVIHSNALFLNSEFLRKNYVDRFEWSRFITSCNSAIIDASVILSQNIASDRNEAEKRMVYSTTEMTISPIKGLFESISSYRKMYPSTEFDITYMFENTANVLYAFQELLVSCDPNSHK